MSHTPLTKGALTAAILACVIAGKATADTCVKVSGDQLQSNCRACMDLELRSFSPGSSSVQVRTLRLPAGGRVSGPPWPAYSIQGMHECPAAVARRMPALRDVRPLTPQRPPG